VAKIPEDPYQRRIWLSNWADQQRKELGDRAPVGARLRLKVDRMIERGIERLDPILDRGLDTSHEMHLPTQDRVGAVYIPGPTPWHILPRALRRVEASDQDTFVDLGCGKGRMVHQAARRPLRRVIGVERYPPVAGFAQDLVTANRARYRCESIEIVNCDAAEFPVPDDLTIVFIADPEGAFRGETLDAVLGNLIESIDEHPRRLRFIYHRGVLGSQLLATGRFRLLRDRSFGRTEIYESCN
jgi:SAM-dependent methyltransferase